MTIGKIISTPPEDPDAERALLGAVLLGRSEALVEARSLVGVADFTRSDHREVFAALCRLADRGDAIDVTTVASETRGLALEAPLGVLAGLLAAATSANAGAYAKRVRYIATARRILSTANELAHVGATPGAVGRETEAGMMSAVQSVVDSLLSGQVGSSEILTPMNLALDFAETLTARERRDPDQIGIETGYSDLDRYVAYRPGELWYIAASPGVGKTSFLANLQDELGRRGVPSLFASVEQPAVQLMDRAIASESRVDSWKIARGQLDLGEWKKVHDALERRSKLPVYIYDDPSMTTARLAAVLQLAKVRHDVKVCFVDYVQIMADESPESEYARISAISRRLAHMARSLKVCIVAACQVSRQGAQTDGQIPRLAELRGSGGLEQDAFVVLALGRKEGETTTQVAVRKNRSGLSGITIELVFDPEHTRFWTRAA